MSGGDTQTFVPTRPASDNSNAAASTAYVTAAIAAAVAGLTPIVPSGTNMVFYQASAPSGWTSVALNDRALRVVSAGGTGGTGGGSNAFSTVFAQTVVGTHTLSTAELASHSHSLNGTVVSGSGLNNSACGAFDIGTGGTSGSAGGGGGHNHTITMSITYSDVIVCTKN